MTTKLIQELVGLCVEKGYAVSISAGCGDISIELCNDTAWCLEIELNTLDEKQELLQLQAAIDKIKEL